MEPPCKQIQVIPFTSGNGQVDQFQLSLLVSKKFKELGFIVDNKVRQNDCENFSCVIWHSENYWQHKQDTVILTIYNSRKELVEEFMGVSKKVEWTFKSGYTKATKSALSNIKDINRW